VGVLLGVPLGIVAGRLAWSAHARRLRVGVEQSVPALVVLGAAVLACLAIPVVATLASRASRRVRPAECLRVE